jgi:hypothetical protein
MSNYPYTPPPPDNIPNGFFPSWNKETLQWDILPLDPVPTPPIPSTE